MRTRIFAIAIAAAAAIVSQAQVTFTSRQSTLEYDYLFGHHGDVVQDHEIVSQTALLSSDSMSSYFYDDAIMNNYFNWWAFVEEEMENSYTIAGPQTDVREIAAGGASVIEAGCDQESLSQMRSYNGQTFNFTVAGKQRYTLTGTLNWAGYTLDPGNQTQLRLERWNGSWWDIVYWTPSLPDGRGEINTGGYLEPGEYRIWCSLLERAFGNEIKQQAYAFNLRFIKRPIIGGPPVIR